MRRGAIWGLTLGFLSTAAPAWAAPPEPVSEPELPSYDAPIESRPAFEPPRVAEPEPIKGVGLMIMGPITIAGGSVLLGVSVANYSSIMREEEGLGEIGALLIWTPLIIVGTSTVVAGAALLGSGVASHVKHRRWMETRQRMVPTFSLVGGGVSFGIAGRF